MKIFQKILLAGEDVQTYTRSGMYYNEEVPADIHDGAVVAVGGPVDHEVYGPNVKDLNVRELTTPEADTDFVAFVDYVGVNKVDTMGVRYYVGDKVAGLYPHAGERTRIRIPVVLDEFWLGDENFDATPVVGQYYTVVAGNTVLGNASATKSTGKLCVKVEDTKPLTEGMVDTGTLYRCTVVAVPA